ncbi:hypothetical protein D5086_001092 [Populus alba]|uniref:Uncharacterized protein n=1 Tax=Populus alba TaxID=43335 RepID=A0ACC4CXR9_POPAL
MEQLRSRMALFGCNIHEAEACAWNCSSSYRRDLGISFIMKSEEEKKKKNKVGGGGGLLAGSVTYDKITLSDKNGTAGYVVVHPCTFKLHGQTLHLIASEMLDQSNRTFMIMTKFETKVMLRKPVMDSTDHLYMYTSNYFGRLALATGNCIGSDQIGFWSGEGLGSDFLLTAVVLSSPPLFTILFTLLVIATGTVKLPGQRESEEKD